MARIGVLIQTKNRKAKTRNNEPYDDSNYLGLNYIISEIEKKHTITFCSARNIDDYDFILFSLIAPQSQVVLKNELRLAGKESHKAQLIVGGAGLTNIRPISNIIDIAVFGRAEGQINDILEGKSVNNNVWRKEEDPEIKKNYVYRQAKRLIPGESNIGCKKKCMFCQYTWTHEIFNDTPGYSSAIKNKRKGGAFRGTEDTFKSLKIDGSRSYISALDGATEKTRYKVNKNISNQDIINKIIEIYENKIKTQVILDLYMICGYPWEQPSSDYLQELKEVLGSVANNKSGVSLYILFRFNVFSPDPLTPMAHLSPDLTTNWRKELTKKQSTMVHQGDNLMVRVSPYIAPPPSSFSKGFL